MPDTGTYPLPEGVEDAVLNRAQLASAFKTSENTVDRWRQAGMPVLSEGTNGRAFEFQLSECFAWKCRRDADQRAAQERADQSVLQMQLAILGGSTGDSEMGLTNRERREIYEVEQAYLKLARERSELIPRKEVLDLLDHLLSSVRKAVIGLPDRLSRDAGLTGRQTEQAVATADDLLRELHDTLQERIGQSAVESDAAKALENLVDQVP
jgi:phage terminase Nu1 subunit (DNA packaging protein)